VQSEASGDTLIEYASQSDLFKKCHPLDDLSRYSFHTGAQTRSIDPDEDCPVLFRDLGITGMHLFLNGRLTRLAGPLTPITYMRTERYEEPYTDYDSIGRIAILQPRGLSPWHSGVPSIYIARSFRLPAPESVAFIPGHLQLEHAARILRGVQNANEAREAMRAFDYDDALIATRGLVRALLKEMKTVEAYAEPLRRRLKAINTQSSDWAKEVMTNFSISEADLCCAWNHISKERRRQLSEVLRSIHSE
jgi:hypothetical protein